MVVKLDLTLGQLELQVGLAVAVMVLFLTLQASGRAAKSRLRILKES
jgi:hypothetical protein